MRTVLPDEVVIQPHRQASRIGGPEASPGMSRPGERVRSDGHAVAGSDSDALRSAAPVAKLRQPVEVLDVGPDDALVSAIDPRPALMSAVQLVELGQCGANSLLEAQATAMADGDRPEIHERARPQSPIQLDRALLDGLHRH
jgi:hypothetical protein